MAVTKTLTGAIPYNKSSKVQQWDFDDEIRGRG